MKKSLLALAVMGAFAGVAQAQSNVTIYGVIDGGVRHQTNVNGAGDNRTTMSSTGVNSTNRLGFRGVEDLGGGLSARFTLESGFLMSQGALDNTTNMLFARGANVGLVGSWGAVDFGRQFGVNFKTIAAYDPFTYNYTTIIPLAGAAAGMNNPASPFGSNRFNNDIQYTGTFGPVTVRAEYALGEVVGSTGNGAAQAVGATYVGGPLTVGGAYTQKKTNIGTAGAAYQDNNQWTVGAAYTFGAFRVAGGHIREKQEIGAGVPDAEVENSFIGVSYNFTPAFKLSGGYYQTKLDDIVGSSAATSGDGKRKLFIIGADYALSKRTKLYAEIDRAKLDGISRIVGGSTLGAAGPQDNQTGVSFGVVHTF